MIDNPKSGNQNSIFCCLVNLFALIQNSYDRNIKRKDILAMPGINAFCSGKIDFLCHDRLSFIVFHFLFLLSFYFFIDITIFISDNLQKLILFCIYQAAGKPAFFCCLLQHCNFTCVYNIRILTSYKTIVKNLFPVFRFTVVILELVIMHDTLPFFYKYPLHNITVCIPYVNAFLIVETEIFFICFCFFLHYIYMIIIFISIIVLFPYMLIYSPGISVSCLYPFIPFIMFYRYTDKAVYLYNCIAVSYNYEPG